MVTYGFSSVAKKILVRERISQIQINFFTLLRMYGNLTLNSTIYATHQSLLLPTNLRWAIFQVKKVEMDIHVLKHN